MSLTEETIKEIRQLSPRSLALIYNHIYLLKKMKLFRNNVSARLLT